jgi:two-component system LytT family response regulator
MTAMEMSERSIRTAIVDDGTLGRRIRPWLEDEKDVEVVGEYRDVRSASIGIDTTRPDLLFLADQMRSGSAFAILESFDDSTAPATIFVTNEHRHAARAFDFSPVVDYLLDPFEADRFRRSIARARLHLRGMAASERPATTSPALPEYLSRLAVKNRGKIYLIRVDEIDWLEAAGNYVRLHVGGRSHLYRDSLSHFESRLDPGRFVRIHRSTIVNIDRITEMEPSFRREHIVLLRDGTHLNLTAPYRARMRAMVGQF